MRLSSCNPVHVGDTLWADSKVLEVRASKSRPYAGIVTVRTRGLNQKPCLHFVHSVMPLKRSESHRLTSSFPEPVELLNE